MPKSRADIDRRHVRRAVSSAIRTDARRAIDTEDDEQEAFPRPSAPGYLELSAFCNDPDINAVELIANVYKILQAEYQYLRYYIGHICDLSSLADVVKRTAYACDVSCFTVRSIIKDKQGL